MVDFKVEKEIAVLSETASTARRLTVTSWNGAPAKLDVRNWTNDGKPLKGIALDENEARKLLDALTAYFREAEGGAAGV